MLVIEGERVYLRDHRPEDLDALHAWISDPEVMRFQSWRTSTRDESAAHLAKCLEEIEKGEERRGFYMALVRKEDERIIGDAGFTVVRKTDDGGVARMGYMLLKPYWGKGYATETAEVMLRYCFTVLNLHKVTAGCDAENGASAKVMEKCGMVREAYFKKHRLLDGEWRDRLEYAVLREDWVKRNTLAGGDAGGRPRP